MSARTRCIREPRSSARAQKYLVLRVLYTHTFNQTTYVYIYIHMNVCCIGYIKSLHPSAARLVLTAICLAAHTHAHMAAFSSDHVGFLRDDLQAYQRQCSNARLARAHRASSHLAHLCTYTLTHKHTYACYVYIPTILGECWSPSEDIARSVV